MEDRLLIFSGCGEHTVGHQNVVVHMTIEEATEAMHEGHGTETRRRRRTGAVLSQRRFDGPQEDPQQTARHLGLGAHVPTHPFRYRQHPLPERNAR